MQQLNSSTMDSCTPYCRGFDIETPLVNRKEAVLQILDAFSQSYDVDKSIEDTSARPIVCYAGHMFGSGKTVLGKRFRDFLVINREYISVEFANENFPGCATPEEGLNTVYNESLYVYLSLLKFPRRGADFEYILYERICKKALSTFPNSTELLSQVLPLIPQGPDEWFRKLLNITNKKYLFLFIDEVGYLGVKNRFHFDDLKSPSETEKSSNVYRTFFRLLRILLDEPFVCCVVEGRSDAIVLRQDDAMPSRIILRFLQLNPFPFDAVDYIVKHAVRRSIPVRQILFPSSSQDLEWFSRIVWEYTGGVPIYVAYVLSELVKHCKSDAQWRDLSKEEMLHEIETISGLDSLTVSLDMLGPKGYAVFSTMLLASILEIPLHLQGMYSGVLNLGHELSPYVLDIASNFGFYYSYDRDAKAVKLVYPKIVLKYVERFTREIPIVRFIFHLFPVSSLSNAPVVRGLQFEVLFSLVLYLRLWFYSKLGDISIFQSTQVGSYVFETFSEKQSERRVPLPKYVPSFHSGVSGEASASGKTYNPDAWNLFYEEFLSGEDGIFIPNSQQSIGPDLMVRVSKPVTGSMSYPTPDKFTDSSQQESLIPVPTRKVVHLIGISLKCYRMTGKGGIGLTEIRAEAEKFLIPVAQQIDLETKNIFVTQLVISTKYTGRVSQEFTDNKNWILNSGVYYKDERGQLLPRSLASGPARGSYTEEWLTVPSRCQLVVCSTSSLERFLGSEAYKRLERIFEKDANMSTESDLIHLSSAFSYLLEEMVVHETVRDEQLPVPTEARLERNIRPRIDTDAMQVEEETTIGKASSVSHFDWKEFLSRRALLPEEISTHYAPMFSRIFGDDPKVVQRKSLKFMGLPEEYIQQILIAIISMEQDTQSKQ